MEGQTDDFSYETGAKGHGTALHQPYTNPTPKEGRKKAMNTTLSSPGELIGNGLRFAPIDIDSRNQVVYRIDIDTVH